MKSIQNILVNCSVVVAFLVLPFSAFAGNGGTIVFEPVSTAVPTLSTSMLMLLSVLLMVVAFRVSKQKESGKFFMMLIGASVLIASTGGVKLISDLRASGFSVILNSPQGSSQIIEEGDINTYSNESGIALKIIQINEPANCDSFPNSVNGSECSVGQVLNNSDSCDIDCRVN